VTRYLIFVVTSLSFLLVSISGTTITVAFPQITQVFHTSLIVAGWVLTMAQITATAFMPMAGKAGEVFGAKRIYLLAISTFVFGSLICAVSPDIEILIFARFIQTMGLAAILPVATTLVSDAFPEARPQAIGLFASIMPIGYIIGPNIGGWLVASFGWRSIFWLNIPLGLLVLLTSFILLKSKKGEGGHLDWLGSGYFTASVACFLVALSIFGDLSGGYKWVLPVLLLFASAVLMIAFVRRERVTANPVIELRFLTAKPFLSANIFNSLYGTAALGLMSFIPLLATSVYGMGTLASGLILTPRSIGMLIATITASVNLPRWGYRWPMFAGTLMLATSLVLFGLEPRGLNLSWLHVSDTVILGVILFLAGLSVGMISPAANNACIDLIPERVGMITGLRGMFRQTSSAVSIAVTTVVLQNFAAIGRGFTVMFYALAAVMLLAIPYVFAMPKAPNDRMAGEKFTPESPKPAF